MLYKGSNRTFQGLAVIPVLFKANLVFKDFSRKPYIQILFKPVQTLFFMSLSQLVMSVHLTTFFLGKLD